MTRRGGGGHFADSHPACLFSTNFANFLKISQTFLQDFAFAKYKQIC